jgi:hypothetical protein
MIVLIGRRKLEWATKIQQNSYERSTLIRGTTSGDTQTGSLGTDPRDIEPSVSIGVTSDDVASITP